MLPPSNIVPQYNKMVAKQQRRINTTDVNGQRSCSAQFPVLNKRSNAAKFSMSLRGLSTEELLQKLVVEGGIDISEEEAQKFRGT